MQPVLRPARDIRPVLHRVLNAQPVQGQTFSLYGRWETSDEYYRRVGHLADLCLERWGDPAELLAGVRRGTRKRRMLRHQDRVPSDWFLREILPIAREFLSDFTSAVPAHLQQLGLRHRWDSVLATVRDEYHLLMLEIELTNRLNRQAFQLATTRIAFLPHCLRDHTRDCRSTVEGDDYVCRGCARSCWVNGVSKLLRLGGVRPYIWMTANLPRLLGRLKREQQTIGVLGIACVPELARGMRLCMRHAVPVVGVPLNANRCARWTGSFQPTSVNLDQIHRFLGGTDGEKESPVDS